MPGSYFNPHQNSSSMESDLTEDEFNELYTLEEQAFFDFIHNLYRTSDPTFQARWGQLDSFVKEWFLQYQNDKNKLERSKQIHSNWVIKPDVDSFYAFSRKRLPRFKNHTSGENFNPTQTEPDISDAMHLTKKRRIR